MRFLFNAAVFILACNARKIGCCHFLFLHSLSLISTSEVLYLNVCSTDDVSLLCGSLLVRTLFLSCCGIVQEQKAVFSTRYERFSKSTLFCFFTFFFPFSDICVSRMLLTGVFFVVEARYM
ncbi:hypothetical protein ABB37_05755 [Leptomonas pyrrhocoris]|uniref:Uncharacterized protein n=1 Tax=Leptomonas pyrrhocoris TaxID=157538 RepID=A0A0M9FZF7_LEPPY|nr:hypothetical protein ABB37_05755 [Leptomonas pyrrhocoris]KPA79290.1 hypothetical protein ABB37_05755 [Leptomonas pyrrhocoris]|eukprot:XP_015657729.1 hypothetical protein ABB37_05755 [Leptomonas pyrrhocoris]